MHWKPAAIATLFATMLAAQPPGPPPGGMGDGIWARNAAFGELETFDLCNGHQPGNGMYHHHINPICLRAQLNDNVAAVATGRLGTQYAEKPAPWTHSPILGWASDGYPVYGPYGYSDPKDAKSPVRRMRSGFRLRNITERHTLPDWVLSFQPNVPQNLAPRQYGPDVSAQFPLGRYVQDYEFVAAIGDLDQYNGRVTVTPEYPNGTYAYFVTLDGDGVPAFPYIVNLQLYGAPGPNNVNVPSDAVDYFSSGTASSDPQLNSWYTEGSQQYAQAITGFDPSAGASNTWPGTVPAGVNVNGGTHTPALADVQRVRYNASAVYVNSNNLPSYTIGPWFEASMSGGVFMNWAAPNPRLVQITRSPTPASTKSPSGMGPVGMWVNGVAIFNTVDGATYSNAMGDDRGGGIVTPRVTHLSSASLERGPIAAGSLVTAFPQFNATIATSTETASGLPWPTTLGGATVTLIDAKGAQLAAGIQYASPAQINYQMPADAASGIGRVTITAGGSSVTGMVNIVPAYPNLFKPAEDHLSADQILTVYGSGIGGAEVTATVDGVEAAVSYSGPEGSTPGLDQVDVIVPAGMAGKGRVNVVVTAGGKSSNPISVTIQ